MIRWTICLLLLVVLGCGGGDLVDHSRDPEMFASNVKELVLTSVEDARESDEPADALWAVVHELSPGELGRQPTGDHLSLYQQLHTLASEIHEECEAVDGRAPELDQRLDELAALAQYLPDA